MSVIFLSLLPILAVFHLVMWFGFTCTLFRPETGDLKRLGYLVGLEDCKAKLQAEEPPNPVEKINPGGTTGPEQFHAVIFGDSFAASLTKAYRAQSGQTARVIGLNWEEGNGVAQIESSLTDGWYHAHGVKTIVVERTEYAWLDTFAEEGEPPAARALFLNEDGASSATPTFYPKAQRWTFANNGNYKVLFCNIAYLFSPTAFKLSNTGVVPLKKKFFNCSYGSKLLFYRGDAEGALTDRNQPRLEQALTHLKELSGLCHQQGMKFYLIIPPVKSYLYYDWVDHPFYPDSKLLETLQARATGFGYVDLKQLFHQKLADGYQDLYYPDDSHWNYPTAQMAANELLRVENTP